MVQAVKSRVFRLPASAYLAVLFLVFCVIPLAFATSGGDEGSAPAWTWRTLLLLIPVLAAAFIARTATVVSGDGVRVRALLGSRFVRWDDMRGLSVSERSVYVVVGAGAIRLPCVRTSDLAAVARLSNGRLPEIAEPTRKYALARRPRKRVRRTVAMTTLGTGRTAQ